MRAHFCGWAPGDRLAVVVGLARIGTDKADNQVFTRPVWTHSPATEPVLTCRLVPFSTTVCCVVTLDDIFF